MEFIQDYYQPIAFGLIIILYYLYQLLTKTEAPKIVDDRKTPYTLNQISEFNGKDGKPTYIGLNGFVFDVSSSDSFKEGGSYANFAGHDISIACAHYSTDDKYLDIHYDPNDNSLTFD